MGVARSQARGTWHHDRHSPSRRRGDAGHVDLLRAAQAGEALPLSEVARRGGAAGGAAGSPAGGAAAGPALAEALRGVRRPHHQGRQHVQSLHRQRQAHRFVDAVRLEAPLRRDGRPQRLSFLRNGQVTD